MKNKLFYNTTVNIKILIFLYFCWQQFISSSFYKEWWEDVWCMLHSHIDIKRQFTQKWKFCYHLFTLQLLPFFILLNTKDDNLKNVVPTDFHCIFYKNMLKSTQNM